MSHRTALTLSIILTLVLAAGIVAGRERLFTSGATAGISGLTSGEEAAPDGVLAEAATSEKAVTSAPRVIEIPLPVAGQVEGSRQSGADGRGARGGDHDDDDHDRYDDDDDEHEEDDDD
jgi:hypothetical protein